MEIQVTVTSSYGRDLIHPACSKALAFARLAGTKTLTQAHLIQIKALGYTVRNVTQQETL